SLDNTLTRKYADLSQRYSGMANNYKTLLGAYELAAAPERSAYDVYMQAKQDWDAVTLSDPTYLSKYDAYKAAQADYNDREAVRNAAYDSIIAYTDDIKANFSQLGTQLSSRVSIAYDSHPTLGVDQWQVPIINKDRYDLMVIETSPRAIADILAPTVNAGVA